MSACKESDQTPAYDSTYELTSEDYNWIAFLDVTAPFKLLNLNYYRNFNVEEGSQYFWTNEEVKDGLNGLLRIYYNKPVGEKVKVKYTYYDGEVKSTELILEIYETDLIPCDNLACVF